MKMCRRVLCSLCALMLFCALTSGAKAEATGLFLTSKPKSGHVAPLVPAMFLVLAGMGISFLFDKHDKN